MPGASGGRQGVGGGEFNINRHRYAFFSSSSDPIYSERLKSNLVSTSPTHPHPPEPHLPPRPPFTPLLIQPLYALLSIKIPHSFHPPRATTCQGWSNRRAGGENDGRGVRNHLDALLKRHNKMDMQVACFSTISGEAKWMSAGIHLTGNLRNVTEVTVNELF